MHYTETERHPIVIRQFGKFTIREIVPSDNDTIRKLILQARKEIDAHEEYFRDDELSNIYESYGGEKSFFMVLTFGKEVIGTIGILPLPGLEKGGCELKKFYMESSWRGFGLGMELITSCLVKADENGYQNCYLETDSILKKAGNLYEKIGFKPVPQNEYIYLPKRRYNWHSKPLQDAQQ